jgi:hypothetical protein
MGSDLAKGMPFQKNVKKMEIKRALKSLFCPRKEGFKKNNDAASQSIFYSQPLMAYNPSMP